MLKEVRPLTHAYINQLKPPAPNANGKCFERSIRDTLQPGLYLIVQPSGHKSWAVRYRLKTGRSRKVTLGDWHADEYGIARARKEARLILQQAFEGRDPAAEKQELRKVRSSNTYPAVVMDFIEKHSKPNNRRWDVPARNLGLAVAKDGTVSVAASGYYVDWRERAITSITKLDVQNLIDGINKRGGISANRHLAALKKFFNWCVERDVLPNSPAATIRKPAKEHARKRALSFDEIRILWVATQELSPTYRDLIRLLLLTGQRSGEVAGMCDAELQGDIWTIPAERTKNGEEHQVPLGDLAWKIVRKRPRVNGMLFSTNGCAPINVNSSKVKSVLDAIIERTAKEFRQPTPTPWQVRDLRRTVATQMGALGINHLVIDKALNHKSGTLSPIAEVYNTHRYLQERRDAFNRWDHEVEECIPGGGEFHP